MDSHHFGMIETISLRTHLPKEINQDNQEHHVVKRGADGILCEIGLGLNPSLSTVQRTCAFTEPQFTQLTMAIISTLHWDFMRIK